MKVVINSCYGGFSISPLALKRYAELSGKECYFFNYRKKKDGKIGFELEDHPCEIEDLKDSMFYSAHTVPNPPKYPDGKKWKELTNDEREKWNKEYDNLSLSFRDFERNDPLLVQVVEELGEKANGEFAELRIVDIPDGVEFYIEDYDGLEHVAEAHRTWF